MTPLFAASIYWHLPILILVFSIVYSATRYDHWPSILNEAFRWSVRMIVFLAGIGVALFALSTWV